MCRYFGLDCGGYEKAILFDFKNSSEERVVRFRRPLFTESERKRMSEWLVSSVPPTSALRILAQIDGECDNASSSRDIHVSRGPFGAFRLSQATLAPDSDGPLDLESEESTPSQELVQSCDGGLDSPDPSLSPWTRDLVHAIFSQSEQISMPASPDFWNIIMDPAGLEDCFGGTIPMPESQGVPTALSSSQNYQFPQSTPDIQSEYSSIGNNPSAITSAPDIVQQDAVTLLKHYATTVITLMTPLRHTKTPWHILFIPHIKHCLAALTLGERLGHADLTVFYGTLAIGAFSLGGVSQSQMWQEKGRTYKQRAREHARLMLRTAYVVPKVSKYKSILMALLTMVQLSMFAGNCDQTDCYFLEAEKFIRLRGLNRKKSRKVRLLHHCYGFERLFHESTLVTGENSPQRLHIRKTIESSGMAIHSLDSLSFRFPRWQNLDEEMSKVKSQELGENDLHLEWPREFPPTLYPEIFGVPEPWVGLLSQTIRLGKEKDAAATGAATNVLSLKDFFVRAKAIERHINRLQRTAERTHASGNSQSQTDLYVLDNMLDAVQQGLAIYFYRRIYDVDASMLQQRVVNVRDCLMRCEYADPSVVHGSSGFIWSAFMAACEAEDSELQASFSNWFKTCAQRSGLAYFNEMLENIEQIWQEKRGTSGTNATWLELMKNKALLHRAARCTDSNKYE